MEHVFLFDVLKWTLISVAIYWILSEIFFDDIN